MTGFDFSEFEACSRQEIESITAEMKSEGYSEYIIFATLIYMELGYSFDSAIQKVLFEEGL